MVIHRETVAVVPARGGSKSIPRKNIRCLGGVPLIAYSIEAALSARTVDRVIVSTDDEEIAAAARQAGAEVPFLRPASIAGDSTPDLPVFDHALQWLADIEGAVPDVVVHLRPTSPLRPPDCVDAAVSLLLSDGRADSVRGVTLAGQNPYKMWRLQPDGTMRPLISIPGAPGTESYNRARQELPTTHWQTGHVDAIRVATIRGQRSMTGERILGLPIDPVYACDLDTELDWQRTEWMLAHCEQPLVRPPAVDSAFPEEIGLVVFDFDGVLTDNRVWVTAGGQEAVLCNRSDGIGLAELRALGVPMLVLSTETDPVVGDRCRKLGIECVQGVADKGTRLTELAEQRRVDLSHVVYVGNDTNDLPCLRLAGCGVAVADAHREVLKEADLVLATPGGHGAVRELCDRVRRHLTSRMAYESSQLRFANHRR